MEDGNESQKPFIQINKERLPEVVSATCAMAGGIASMVYFGLVVSLLFSCMPGIGAHEVCRWSGFAAVVGGIVYFLSELLNAGPGRLSGDSSKNRRFLLFTVLAVLACMAFAFGVVNVASTVLSWFASGYLFAWAYVRCLSLLAALFSGKRLLIDIAAQVFLGALLAPSTAMLSRGGLLISLALLLLACVACFYFTRDRMADVPSSARREKGNPTSNISQGSFLLGLSLGIAAALFSHVVPDGIRVLWGLLAALSSCGALAAFLYALMLKEVPLYKLPQWSCFAVVAVLFLLASLCDPEAVALLCIGVSAVFAFYNVLNCFIAVVITRKCGECLWRGLAYNRLMALAGIVISSLVANALYELLGLPAQDLSQVIAVLGVLLTLVSVVLMFRRSLNKWVTSDEALTAAAQEVPAPTRENRWKACCEELADEFKLSEREREVLLLLSRGITTKRIQDNLCVSYATAKSHVYHIYTKFDVHSQQELIAMIEERYAANGKS